MIPAPLTPPASRSVVLAQTSGDAQPKTSGCVSAPSAREVARVLVLDDETHGAALVGFRAGGGNVRRWLPWDMATMGRAITAVEDVLELRPDRPTRRVLRMRLRDVRRRLEDASDDAVLRVPYQVIADAVRREMGETRRPDGSPMPGDRA